MSREVRRVQVGWKHPVEYNPYWQPQSRPFMGKHRPPSRLHGPTERFVALYEGPLSKRQADWDRAKAEWDAGIHKGFSFLLNYYGPDGYLNSDGTRDEPHPYPIYGPDGETVEREVFFAGVADVQRDYPFEEEEGSRPEADRYMPDFDVPDDELGWCLYETVSEGTPTTPVFATAEELIEHLCTIGQDYDQQPMRRESAEQIVRTGFTLGSLVSVGGAVYRSDVDADKIAALSGGSAPNPTEATGSNAHSEPAADTHAGGRGAPVVEAASAGRVVPPADAAPDCPTCDGSGELVDCSGGRCSHINDTAYRCHDCNGTGVLIVKEARA